MKVKVLKKFRDKRNGKIYKTGSTIDVTKERYEEIINTDASLIEMAEETTKTAEKESKRKTKAK